MHGRWQPYLALLTVDSKVHNKLSMQAISLNKPEDATVVHKERME